MKLIINTLATFGMNALNKGELGEIKQVRHIGYTAQRVSSQCVKRAARSALEAQGITLGSRMSSQDVWNTMVATAKPNGDAELVELYSHYCTLLGLTAKDGTKALAAIKKLGTATQEEGEDATITGNTIYFAAPGQVEAAARGVFDGYDLSVDIALFGRMVPQGRGAVDGALSTSGWMGVSEMEGSSDFFTGTPDNSSQAVAMGHTSLASGSEMYGFHVIDLIGLAENLPHATAEELSTYVAATVRAMVEAQPSGGMHNANGWSLPYYVMAELAPTNTSNVAAFAYEPVTASGEAVERLRAHVAQCRQFESGRDGAMVESYRAEGTSLEALYSSVAANVAEFYRD